MASHKFSISISCDNFYSSNKKCKKTKNIEILCDIKIYFYVYYIITKIETTPNCYLILNLLFLCF